MFRKREQNMQTHVYTGCSKIVEASTDEDSTAGPQQAFTPRSNIMALPADVTTGTWTLDNSHSEIGFTVRHAGISKVRGQFKEAEATLSLAENVADSKVNATIKTASFDSGDANRDGHVRGEDFFNVEKFPEMTFRATSVEGDGEDYTLTGDLTIRGITKPVELEVEFTGEIGRASCMERG